MVSVQIYSDVHIDHMPNGLPKAASEYLILAGDLCNFKTLHESLEKVSKAYKHVWYTPGNHEHWGSSIKATDALIETRCAALGNITYLRPGAVEDCLGTPIVGCTLWYDFDNNPVRCFDLNYMPDISQISDIRTLDKMFEVGIEHEAWLRKAVTKDCIVVTHYCPSWKSCHPIYRSANTNAAFIHDVEDLIIAEQPKYWIHGHTHKCFDYNIDNTRVICNAHGYPGERNHFSKSFTIEI
jgi:Calcineurin-like phosphoesterase